MWEFKTLEIKQAMKYIGSGECLEEVLVPYCGRLIVKYPQLFTSWYETFQNSSH